MNRFIVCEITAAFFAEDPTVRFNAVQFRNCTYVASPRHMDAVNLAFSGMSDLQKRLVSERIADGKERMLFGTALGDGTEWEWDEKWQSARLKIYGFD